MKEVSIIPRPQYMEMIERSMYRGQIIALTGQRRVGKSFILKALKRDKEVSPENNVIYIDKEKFEFDDIENYQQLNEYIASRFDSSRHNFILIDEVQDVAGFEKALRSWRTEPDTEVVITGSNAYLLSSQLTTLIGGRYHDIYVQSLSYLEFLQFHKLDDSEEALMKYLDYGGLPGLIRFGLNSEGRQYQLDVLSTAILRDVVQRNEIRNVNFLDNLLRFVADNIGKPISPFNISNFMKARGEKVTPTLVSNYLKMLSDAYVMTQVPRFDIHGKAILEGNGKFYFEDLGIRNALTGGARQGDIEKLIENAVYQQLVRMGFDVKVGKLRAGEIDFVCTRPSKAERIYVQVAYMIGSPETREREFGALKRIADNYPKYVISMSPLVGRMDDDGVTHIGLRGFLRDGFGGGF